MTKFGIICDSRFLFFTQKADLACGRQCYCVIKLLEERLNFIKEAEKS